MMKDLLLRNLLTVAFLLLLPLSAKATGWSAEVIRVNGQKWELLEKPLNNDSILRARFEEFIPKEHSWSTANPDGFTGYWEIVYGRLYLKKVVVDMYDEILKKHYEVTYDAHDLREVFAPHYTIHGISAEWVNDEKFRMGRGEVLIYFHGGFMRNYEEELFLSIDSGRVTDHKYWRNSIHVDGMEIDEAVKKTMELFPVERFPMLEDHRVVILTKDFKLHPDGHFDDCHITMVYLDEDKTTTEEQQHPIIEEVKKIMRSIYPWKVYCIYGEFVPKDIRYSFPLGKRRVKN